MALALEIPEELASKLIDKFSVVGKVVVLCSIWGRHDVDTFHRKHFNRELEKLAEGNSNLLYHRVDRKLNSKLRGDGIHLTPDG